ncbi:unnamed protein product [Durusdinium trenchii]|uniref:RING-type domain-containing protein n=1 Tax=Durusdinium trenchii TaxID=1381693 RepID=A0ABP0N4G8_9DINO
MVLKLESLAIFGLSDVGQLQLILETLSAPQLLQLDLSFNAQEALLRPLNAILESRPLTKLNLTGSAFCLSSLTALPSSLEELRIAGCHVPLGPEGGELLQRFLQNCENLQVLELGSIGQVQPWLRRPLLALLRSCAPLLRRLQAKLPGNLLQAGLGGPFETGTFLCSLPLLEWLDLEPGGPLPSSFPALLAAPRASLRVLRVAHALLSDGLGSELVKRLRGAGALQQLSLVDCGLGANTVGSFLVPLPSWPQLTHLNLSHNGFAGAQATTPLLKTLSVSRRLRQLRLCACELDMDSALVACAPLVVGLPGLDLLDLRGNARPSEDACLSFIATARQEFARGTFSPWPSGAPPASLELECEVGQLPEKLGRFQLRCPELKEFGWNVPWGQWCWMKKRRKKVLSAMSEWEWTGDADAFSDGREGGAEEAGQLETLKVEHAEVLKTLRLQRNRNVELTTCCARLRGELVGLEAQGREAVAEAQQRTAELETRCGRVHEDLQESQRQLRDSRCSAEHLAEDLVDAQRHRVRRLSAAHATVDELRGELRDAVLRSENTELLLSIQQAEARIIEVTRNELLTQTQCCVCMEAPRSVVLEPCMHYALCLSCAQQMRSCPVCRRGIRSVLCTLSV